MADDSVGKDPTLQELIDKFQDQPEARQWLEGVNAVPDFASAFSEIGLNHFVKTLGEELGTRVYNAAHPSNPRYST